MLITKHVSVIISFTNIKGAYLNQINIKHINTFVNTSDEGDDSGTDDGVTLYDDLLMTDPSGKSDGFFIEPTDSERFTAIDPYCLVSAVSLTTCFIFSGEFCSEFNIDLMPLRVLDKEDVEELLVDGGFLVVGGGGGNAGFLLTTGANDLFSI